MPNIDVRADLRRIEDSLARRTARARDAELVDTALYIAGLACPFPMRVLWEPERDRLSVVAGRYPVVRLAEVTSEEAHRMSTDHVMAQRLTAATLGKRARDTYLALVPLPIPANITLGQD